MKSRVVSDGWHKLYAYRCYVKNGLVAYAVDCFGCYVYPYIWNGSMLEDVSGCISYDALRHRLKERSAHFL